MKDIVIIGGGGLGREIRALIENVNAVSAEWNFKGFYDDLPAASGDAKILGRIDDLNHIQHEFYAIIAIAAPEVKEKICSRISNELISFPVLIHPRSFITDKTRVLISEGSVICANSILSTNIKIGKHCTVNMNVTLAHDTEIGDYSTIMPGTQITGGAILGEKCYIGSGSVIPGKIHIVAGSQIKPGSIL